MKPLICPNTAVVNLFIGVCLVACAAGNNLGSGGGGHGTGTRTSVSSGGAGTGAGGGGFVFGDGGLIVGDGAPQDDLEGGPCSGPNPPASCFTVVDAGPFCGNGTVDQDTEVCDDGNGVPGDGCDGTCQVEPGFTCPPTGGKCTSMYACGNGVLDPGEVCDDKNTNDGDGCSADCLSIEPGYICPNPGQACVKTAVCGNKRVDPGEACDDGNATSGDGCSSDCQVETGYQCAVPGTACTHIPRCGDKILQPKLGEVCDDGNTTGGDGCSATCQVEPGWVCPTPGSPCKYTVVCGDGVKQGNEQCDDGNKNDHDGCSSTCTLEPGFACPMAGSPCVAKCGDGILTSPEQCDDGNATAGDGCSPLCRWEQGFACTGNPGHYTCTKTVCGNGSVETTEGCDPGTGVGGVHDTGNGCSPFCTLEPSCKGPGGACSSTCGDGILLASAGEECDDGNTINGDGCSSNCKIESGWSCSQPPLGNSMKVSVVYRDFNARSDASGHIDFNPGATGQNAATPGLVQTKLDSLGKPVFAPAGSAGFINSAASFAQWYRDTPAYNKTIPDHITLWDNGKGGFVNRWGPNGEQWVSTSYGTQQYWCSDSTCTNCNTYPTGAVCLPVCIPWGNSGSCMAVITTTAYDGNPVFFPIDPAPSTSVTASGFQLMSPVSPYQTATIAPAYGGNWTPEPSGQYHNFNFTSEIRYWFLFDSTKTYELDFTGDDDVWVFVNRTLAVDLGGIHVPVSGSIILSSANAAQFGLTNGNLYEIAVFQAERQTTSSTFKLTLAGFNMSSSVCGPVCGDSVVTPPEQCDNGKANNTGGYGKCNTDCTRGAYCGDGKVNGTEKCDDGINMSAYNLVATQGCAPGCVLPPYCGDGIIQAEDGEACDDGKNNSTYGGCGPGCQFAGFCGDGKVNGTEACDDGANDGSYGNCAPGCVLGPRCGDSITQTEYGEACDDGAKNGTPGDPCSTNCRKVGGCGDAIVESPEQCDDGVNLGGYGKCAPGCVRGPYCGDGVVQKPHEECDDGHNTGGYGRCGPNCKLGPYCGDGVMNGPEGCDHGAQNGAPGDTCTAGCTVVSIVH